MGSRKQTGPRALCAYFVESKECDGVTSVPEEATFLVKKCIEDKIFSESTDEIAICRSDTTSSISFVAANWDGLRRGLQTLEKNESSENGTSNPLESLDDVVEAVNAQAQEDVYEDKKIIYFATLSSYIIDKEEFTELADKLRSNDVFISFILPNKTDMSETQLQNCKLVRSILKREEYDNVAFVTNMERARQQILNTQSKKPKRPAPWNILFEVTPGITINVGGYACTRKNNISEMTRVLTKQIETSPDNSTAASTTASSSSGDVDNGSVGQKTAVVEPAKMVLEKETIYKENDGSVISEEDIGKGYYFGDKLIPFNDLENESSYQSGAKCFKLLAFCPKDKISPSFHAGDGITLFYPKKDDVVSEVKFKALMKAMTKMERIAIVRRIYMKNSRVTIGSLVPDDERECLVFTELCFADDISIPPFPSLIRPEEVGEQDEEMNAEVSEKEALIDELIRTKTLDSFKISEGPSDPAVKNMREAITKKIIKDSRLDEESKKTNNIDIFFQSLIVCDEDTLSEQILKSFPLSEAQVKDNERFAGQVIFRKRVADEKVVNEEEKKIKVEGSSKQRDEEIEMEEKSDEMDDLLDEL